MSSKERPGIRPDLVAVFGQDMLRNPPCLSPASFVPLVPSSPPGTCGRVCHCLIGQPCTPHGATTGQNALAGTATFSSTTSSSSSSLPVPGHSYSLRSGFRHLTPELASQLLQETEILRPCKRPMLSGHSGGSLPSKTAAAIFGASRKSGHHCCLFADCEVD